ncbi:MAG: septal ring lytic transglycosylase RlpA family protein [Burkholderiaceae bacterium]
MANACAAPPPASADPGPGDVEVGWISYYGQRFAGRPTANGERFDPRAMTMAHPRWPFGTRVRVTVLETDRQVVLRINDRGPSIDTRIADVSAGAARKLDMIEKVSCARAWKSSPCRPVADERPRPTQRTDIHGGTLFTRPCHSFHHATPPTLGVSDHAAHRATDRSHRGTALGRAPGPA